VLKVYDGDTITIVGRVDRRMYKFSVRLARIDAPEIRTKFVGEKRAAIRSRDALQSLVGRKVIELRGIKREKYGRVLAEVWFDGMNVNDWMLQQGYAVGYDGNAKKKYKE